MSLALHPSVASSRLWPFLSIPISVGLPSSSVKAKSAACSRSHLTRACLGDLPLSAASSPVACHASTAAASLGAYRGCTRVQIVWRLASFGKEEARFDAACSQPRFQRPDLQLSLLKVDGIFIFNVFRSEVFTVMNARDFPSHVVAPKRAANRSFSCLIAFWPCHKTQHSTLLMNSDGSDSHNEEGCLHDTQFIAQPPVI